MSRHWKGGDLSTIVGIELVCWIVDFVAAIIFA